MAQMIPLFLAEEENSSSMARQRVFRDLNDPLDCYDDLIWNLFNVSASLEFNFSNYRVDS